MERISIPLQLRVVQSQPGLAELDSKWSTGLCECWGDMEDCKCLFTVLMVMLLGFLVPAFSCFEDNRVTGGCPCLPLLDCVGCGTPASLAMRAAVRERYGIEGDVCSDCFYGCCCYPLSWCQISREIKRRAAVWANANSLSSSETHYTPLMDLDHVHLI
ncbi:placenta-specific gene 8 protein-like [Garra rufa]|uniref:placenta-specific gene 8 protein-like n=1 Tax=Garra rufa TaxID=137080 RepID=UPI003CCECFF2